MERTQIESIFNGLLGLITNQDVWIDMIEQRNPSSHVYNQDEVRGILTKLETYRDAFEALYQALKHKLES